MVVPRARDGSPAIPGRRYRADGELLPGLWELGDGPMRVLLFLRTPVRSRRKLASVGKWMAVNRLRQGDGRSLCADRAAAGRCVEIDEMDIPSRASTTRIDRGRKPKALNSADFKEIERQASIVARGVPRRIRLALFAGFGRRSLTAFVDAEGPVRRWSPGAMICVCAKLEMSRRPSTMAAHVVMTSVHRAFSKERSAGG